MKIISYIFYLIAILFFLSGLFEIAFSKDFIPELNIYFKISLGLVSIVIAQILSKMNQRKK